MKVNMHTSHPSAFISSTFIDLYQDRAVVADVLKQRGLNVNALDVRPASTQSSRQEILTGIRESDFVILLVGNRYGSILKSMTGSDAKSITWWEYSNALLMGKPIIAYFKQVDLENLKFQDDNSDSEYRKKRWQLERFKTIVTREHNPAFYSDPQDLANRIDKSLINIYRAGVRALNSKNIELKNGVAQLESELSVAKSRSVSAPFTGHSGLSRPQGGLGLLNAAMSSSPEVSALRGFIDKK